MNMTTDYAPPRLADPGALREAWQRLTTDEPGVRTRAAAARLQTSEAELLATQCGDGVTRLDADWGALLGELEPLGPVMALTRNEHAVLEVDGRYRNVQNFGAMGQVLDERIDMRLFLSRWSLGFAVRDEIRGRPRRSLHFFDASGTAIHKIYLREGADHQAFEEITERFTSANQSTVQPVSPDPAPEPERPDRDIDLGGFRDAWVGMQDTHEFHGLLQRFGVTRTQALRLIGQDFAYPVPATSLRTTLELVAGDGLPIMIFVGNRGAIQIHSGPIHRLKETGPWFNVLDPGVNLHLREDHIGSAWVVRKPTRNGIISALELYAGDGEQIALIVSKRQPEAPESYAWRRVLIGLGATRADGVADRKDASR